MRKRKRDNKNDLDPRTFENIKRQFENTGPRHSVSHEEREMHRAICSECGNECTVPFKPIEGKPVYCRDCFRKHKQN